MAVNMFLKLEGKRSGAIKGESTHVDHVDEIEIYDFSFSLKVPTALGGTGESVARRAYSSIRVEKLVDTASTAIMQALVVNDQMKTAIISVRKAGHDPLLYYRIELTDGRISSYENVGTKAESGNTLLRSENGSELIEVLHLSFSGITVEYLPQSELGYGKGRSMFNDMLRGHD